MAFLLMERVAVLCSSIVVQLKRQLITAEEF